VRETEDWLLTQTVVTPVQRRCLCFLL